MATIIGVFKIQAQAEQAVNELHSSGFSDEQIHLAVYHAPGVAEDLITDAKRAEAGEGRTTETPGPVTGTSEVTRTVVTVNAEGKAEEALAILLRHGANNADIPEALKAEVTPLFDPEADRSTLPSQQPVDARSSDSFFEAPAGPDSPGNPLSPRDVGEWDNPTTRG